MLGGKITLKHFGPLIFDKTVPIQDTALKFNTHQYILMDVMLDTSEFGYAKFKTYVMNSDKKCIMKKLP